MFPFRFGSKRVTDDGVNALAPALDLAPALVVLPEAAAVADAVGGRECPRVAEARALFESGPVVLIHAAMIAQRPGLRSPPRSPRLFDRLESGAFVKPARFCAPSAAGLAMAAGVAPPQGAEALAVAVRTICADLLGELAARPTPSRDEARGPDRDPGGPAGRLPVGSTRSPAPRSGPLGRPWRGSGLEIWSRIAEWEDEGPAGEPGSEPVDPAAAQERLATLLARSGLSEPRPAQATFAAETAYAFEPREREGEPRMMLAEAGTGVGKTLGYLAPASLWSEANGGPVWISTYTRALQRQIERESRALFPDPAERARRAVVRKGRENYLCLLNFQEAANTAQLGGADLVGIGLVARWVRASGDGDMTGGDFPAWLPSLFAIGPAAQASAANLVDRRGECLHAACPHYRSCFVEKAVRASRGPTLVIANHALVMSQAAFDGARTARGARPDVETAQLRRVVFDEGHHLFDAADAAFSAVLSGAEAAEMRRWIRGPEARGRRGRGLEARLLDMLGEREEARAALVDAAHAAIALPGEGWSGRIAQASGEALPSGPVEAFLAAVIEQLRARAAPSAVGMDCAASPAVDEGRAAPRNAAAAIALRRAALLTLARALANALDDEAGDLCAWRARAPRGRSARP